MLFVVIGTSAGRSRDEIMAVYPRHKAFLDEFMARGEVVGVGPFTDPGGGNMALFRTRHAAETFATGPVLPRRPGQGVPGQGLGRPDAVVAATSPICVTVANVG